MYKHKKFSLLGKKYSSYQDTGSVGLMMKICHQGLEKVKAIHDIKKNSSILEIGAGTSPQIGYIKHSYKKYIFLENSNFALSFLKKKYKSDNKISFKYYNGKKIPFRKSSFDRIIISHVLEHIPNPEVFLDQMFNILKKDGILSIALPSDPGFMWRVGRFFLRLTKVKRKLGLTLNEYDYMIANEHINSIFNLISIIKYKYGSKVINESYLPFHIKLLDFNLFYNVTLRK